MSEMVGNRRNEYLRRFVAGSKRLPVRILRSSRKYVGSSARVWVLAANLEPLNMITLRTGKFGFGAPSSIPTSVKVS